jgi:uncharacterized repeat protein (TIGR03803 family)
MSKTKLQNSIPRTRVWQIAFIVSGLILSLPFANAQKFKVLHTFTNGADGAYPYAGLVIDAKGNLYGTANQGGKSGSCFPAYSGCGTVFELSPSKSGWAFHTLYTFQGGADGQGPYGEVMFGPDGSLYGTTIDGGNSACPSGCGSVFNLKRPKHTWTETVLYDFQGNNDGFYPTGNLAIDASGNLYGTTTQGGANGPGTIYELKHSAGKWVENILWNFNGQEDGANPYAGVTLGSKDILYATTSVGGTSGLGTLDELTKSENTWKEKTLYQFANSDAVGVYPFAGLLLEKSGVLLGATEVGGAHQGGAVFSLTPSDGDWKMVPLYSFTSEYCCNGPAANLIMDAAGNLYGTTQGAKGVEGTVFKLAPKGDDWVRTVLHRFTGGSDGDNPLGALVFDSAGNLYGTTELGGSPTNGGYGVVFEITNP